MILFLIAIGGAVGSVCRYLLGTVVQRASHLAFPVGTLSVNLLGCIAVGFLAKLFLNSQTESAARAALIVGLCGGFTTFSTFSLETVGLAIGGEWGKAAWYVTASVATCLAGTAVGFVFGRSLSV
jgi:CrcB protein